MKSTTRLFPLLGMIAVFLISACAPAAPSLTPEPTLAPPEAIAPSTTAPSQPEATLVPTEIPPQPIATSRGPDLHATDPSTVTLAAGQLQLVEFFRFT